MFKLFVVVSTLCSLATAHPGYLHGLHAPLLDYAPVLHAPAVVKVGAVVRSLPPAVSHQSSTIVHSGGHIVTPILAPAVKTVIAAPVVKTVVAPAIHPAPLLGPYHGLHLGPHYH